MSCIKKATHSAAEGTILPGEAITLERPDEKPLLQVVISTLWDNHQCFGMGVLDEPYGILFVNDPNRPQETSSEQLQRLFGLTRSEGEADRTLGCGRQRQGSGGGTRCHRRNGAHHVEGHLPQDRRHPPTGTGQSGDDQSSVDCGWHATLERPDLKL